MSTDTDHGWLVHDITGT